MRLTIERVLNDQAITALYPTYAVAFDPLRTRAAARHVLTPDEFTTEMVDERIEKYLVWDKANNPVGLTTLTTDLSTIPWISGRFYSSLYPEAAARGALFYLGYILVESSHRSSNALVMMTDEVNRRLLESRGVLGFDLCSYNDAQGIGQRAKRLLSSSHRIELADTQSYYAADYRESRP